MNTIIYLIIFLLFIIYILWTWNNTKGIENIWIRISYLFVGTLFITFITFILFEFSKNGVEYPKQEMVGQVRKIVMLLFIPINGFLTLPQIALLMTRVKEGDLSKDDRSKKMRIILITFIIIILFECIYFKNIQNGIINTYINLENK